MMISHITLFLHHFSNYYSRLGTFLLSDIVLEVCENYIITHLDLSNVFETLDVAIELAFDKISEQCNRLICSNLGRFYTNVPLFSFYNSVTNCTLVSNIISMSSFCLCVKRQTEN